MQEYHLRHELSCSKSRMVLDPLDRVHIDGELRIRAEDKLRHHGHPGERKLLVAEVCLPEDLQQTYLMPPPQIAVVPGLGRLIARTAEEQTQIRRPRRKLQSSGDRAAEMDHLPQQQWKTLPQC